MLLLRKWTAKSPFFQKSCQIGPYRTYTVPHLPILFPMWPANQKELPTPALDSNTQTRTTSRFENCLPNSAVATKIFTRGKIWKKNWNLQRFVQFSPNSLLLPHSQSIWSCFYQDTTNFELPSSIPYSSNTIGINLTAIFTGSLYVTVFLHF